MNNSGTLIIAYLASGVLFIRALAGLSKQETARRGNVYGMVGMALAILITAVGWLHNGVTEHELGLAMLVVAIVVGGSIGAVLARRVEMTGMPELVAVLHSFVGLAAVMVGFSSYLVPHGIFDDE